MSISVADDRLAAVTDQGFTSSWSWKDSYVSTLLDGNSGTDGYERFSQYSASPDTTIVFAGPARYTAVDPQGTGLLPIGLVDGLNFSSQPQLQRLYEIGSNRAFFTRGKTINTMSFGRMLTNQYNILAALRANAYTPTLVNSNGDSAGAANPNSNIMMNLDSEYFAVPFGLLVVFKTRGGATSGTNGSVLAAVYCEYCMFSGYQFSVASQSPVITEGISMEFDRVVPLSFQ